MNRLIKVLFFFIKVGILIIGSTAYAQTSGEVKEGGFIVLAGKEVTQTNSVLVAQNCYQAGNRNSFLKKFPRTKNDSGELIRFNNSLAIPKQLISYEWMVLQTDKGYLNSNAVGVNEDGVAIGGMVSLSSDRNIQARRADPLIDRGIPGAISYVALQRSRSARQCVRIIGEFFNSYGIKEAIGIAVADKDEIWYMETGGGNHWAAIKIPKDVCWLQGNSYRIGFIDPENSGVMVSPGLKNFAREKGLWNPEEELFNFAKAFGGRKAKIEKLTYQDSRKIWRAYNKLVPSKTISPDRENFPNFIRPKEKVTVKKLTSILRDEYRGTRFYPYASDTTFNIDTTYRKDSVYQKDTLYRIDSLMVMDTTCQIDSIAKKESPIANKSTVHSSIVEIRKGFRAELRTILWTSTGNPVTTPYIPFYFGIDNVPTHYNSQSIGGKSASHYFRKLSDIYYSEPSEYYDTFPVMFNNFQRQCFKERKLVDKQAFRLIRGSPDMAVNFLTVTVDAYCQDALDIAKRNLEQLTENE
jgi:dipeptidase